MQRRLYRSRTERMIAGICGGLGQYFDIDPTIVRIVWVVISLMAGIGVLLYLILWVVIPLELPAAPGSTPPGR